MYGTFLALRLSFALVLDHQFHAAYCSHGAVRGGGEGLVAEEGGEGVVAGLEGFPLGF